jgi:hypothetical protein
LFLTGSARTSSASERGTKEILMKTIAFVALLAAAGCSKKTPDCDASIGKGMDNFAASVKTSAPNPQLQETRLTMISKLRGTLTQRCNEDKWPAEAVTCFTTVGSMKDMQTCQAKLSDEQRTKLVNEIRQVMMGSMGSMRMPNGLPGHPPMLGSAGSGGPEATGGMPGSHAGSAPAPAVPAGSAQAPASPAPPAPAGSAAPVAGSGGW